MKTVLNFTTALLIGSVFLSSCGGGGQQESSTDDAALSVSETASSPETTVADPEAKSDSKGVGRFTSVELGPIDREMVEKGKTVFAAKCSSCHKTTDEKLVGPGLKGVTERRTPEWIMNQITNPEEMTHKDPVAKALLEKHLVQMTFQNVSDDETRQLLEFFRENDKSN